jgi:hypothetical protein
VGGVDRRRAGLEAVRERADGGQLLAGLERTFADRRLDARGDLPRRRSGDLILC